MTEAADVVVVGGGALGVSCAYHLNQQGVERPSPGKGRYCPGHEHLRSRFHRAVGRGMGRPVGRRGACLRAIRDGVLHRTERDGQQLRVPLQRHDVHRDNLRRVGTSSSCRWPTAKRSTIRRRAGYLAEIEQMTGIVRAGAHTRAVFHSEGIQITARDAVRAAARRLAAQGGRIEVRRPVTELLVQQGHVIGVATSRGRVRTDTVVLATAMLDQRAAGAPGPVPPVRASWRSPHHDGAARGAKHDAHVAVP